MAEPDRHDSVELCAERIVARCGPRLAVAAPLGLGKPNALLNALFKRAQADPALSLQIFTALSLARPSPKSELERRFAPAIPTSPTSRRCAPTGCRPTCA